jgi:Zn-dependent protease/CBS domain-containing protein
MTGDIYLGKLFGIPFRLHWSWFLAVFLIAWTLAAHFFPQTLPELAGDRQLYWGLGLFAALGLFLSVLLHELGHAFVARRFGVSVRGIRLFVFGGVAELGSEPKKPSHEILIAIGGPAVTLVLIILYDLGMALILANSDVHWEIDEGILSNLQGGSHLAAGAAGLLYYLGFVNTMVLIFNLIPAFPLDGGRVFRGVVWAITGNYLNATRVAGAVGIAFGWLLFISGFALAFSGNFFGGIWFFFLGMFLQNAAQASIAYAQLQQLFRGVRVAETMCRDPLTLDAGLSLAEAVDRYFLRHPYKAYPVVDGGADNAFRGMLTLRAVQERDRAEWDNLRVGDVVAAEPPLPALHPRMPVVQALRQLAETGHSRLPVLEDGALVGLLSRRDIMDFLEIRSGLTVADADDASSEPRS